MADNINLGSVTLEISDAQAKIDKLSGAIGKIGDASDPAKMQQKLQRQVNAVKGTLTSVTAEVTSLVSNFNKALEGMNGDSITNSLNSLSKSVANISDTLTKSFGDAMKDMTKDATMLDFSKVISQLRTLSNAFSMSAKEATLQQEAQTKNGAYKGDSFGLKGFTTQVEKIKSDVLSLQEVLQSLKTTLESMNDTKLSFDGFGQVSDSFKQAVKAIKDFDDQDKTIPQFKVLASQVQNILKLAKNPDQQIDEEKAYTKINSNLQATLDALVDFNGELETEVAKTNKTMGNLGGDNPFSRIEGRIANLNKMIVKMTNATLTTDENGKQDIKLTSLNGIMVVIQGMTSTFDRFSSNTKEMSQNVAELTKNMINQLDAMNQSADSLNKFFKGMGEAKMADFRQGMSDLQTMARNLNAEYAKFSEGKGGLFGGAKPEQLTAEQQRVKGLYDEWKQLLQLQAELGTERKGVQPETNLYAALFDEQNAAGQRIAMIKKELSTIDPKLRDTNLESSLADKKNGYLATLKAEAQAAEEAAAKEERLNTIRAQYAKEHPTETQAAQDQMAKEARNQQIEILKAQIDSLIPSLQNVTNGVENAKTQLTSLAEVDLSKLGQQLLVISALMATVIRVNNEAGSNIQTGNANTQATGPTNFEETVKRLEEVRVKAEDLANNLPTISSRINGAFDITPVATSINTVYDALNRLNELIKSFGVGSFGDLAKAVNEAKNINKSQGSKETNQLYKEYEEYQQRLYDVQKKLQTFPSDTPAFTVTAAIQEMQTLQNLMDKIKNGERDADGNVITKGFLDYDDADRDKNREARIERKGQYHEIDLTRTRAEIKATNQELDEGTARVESYYKKWEELTRELGNVEKEQIGLDHKSEYWNELEKKRIDQRNKRLEQSKEWNKSENAVYRNADREKELADLEREKDAETKLAQAKHNTAEAEKAKNAADAETRRLKRKKETEDDRNKRRTESENRQKENRELKSTVSEIEATYKRISEIRANMVTGLLDSDEADNEIKKLTALNDKLRELKASPVKGLDQDALLQGQDKSYVDELYNKMDVILKMREKAMTEFEKTGDATRVNELDGAFNNLYAEVTQLNEAYRDLAKEQDMFFQNSQMTKTQNEASAALTEMIQQYGELQRLYEKRADGPLTGAERVQLENAEKRIEQIKKEHKEFEKLEAVKKAAASADTARSYSEMALNRKNFASSYDELTKAIQRYKAAKESGDTAEQESAEVTISKYKNAIKEAEKYMSLLDKESNAYKELAQNVGKVKTAIGELGQKQEKNAKENEKADNQSLDRLAQLAKTYIQMRGLRTLWKNATSYVTEYYDALNEIRVVTGKSEQESLTLGENYRRLAKEMSTTSQELAESAVTLYRQGLSDEQVNERLKYTTMYSKTSGLEMGTATELMTATINAYSSYVRSVEEAGEVTTKVGYNAEEVASMFTAVGNAAASSGEEIGTAAQKVASVAGEAGLSLEYLSAYIATLSEKTRLAPETIGTALNTMIARLRQIKQNGFNEEDETKINDVAKALRTIGVSLMDTEGNWRDLNDIFEDIGKKWDDMSDKQKSYVATTMAGTRQQNYFIALMNDLAKADEGASRAMELYNIAMNSSGSVAKSYSTYMESASAAADRFKQAMENVYSTLLNANTIKGLNDIGAGIANGFAKATESMHGFNVIIPVVLGGIATQIAGAASLRKTMNGMNLIEWFTAGGALGTKIGLVVAAVAALIAVISLLANVSDQKVPTMAEKFSGLKESIDKVKQSVKDIGTAQQDIVKDNTSLKTLRDEYAELSTKANKTKEDNERLKTILDELSALSPGVASALEGITDVYSYQEGVIDAVNKQLERNIELSKEVAKTKIQEQLPTLEETANKLKDLDSDVEVQSKRVNAFNNYIKKTYGVSATNVDGTYLYNIGNKDYSITEMLQQMLVGALKSGKLTGNKGSDFGAIFSNWGIVNAQGQPFNLSVSAKDRKEWKDKNYTNEQIWQELSKNDQFAEFVKTAANMVNTLSANESELETSRTALESTTKSLLKYYQKDSNLPDFQKETLDQQVDEIIDGFNYEGDYDTEFLATAEKIEKASAEAQKNYKEWQEVRGQAIKTAEVQLNKAYNDFKADPTKENQEAYNQLVDQYNDLFDGTLKKFGDDLVKTTEEATSTAAETPKQETVQDLVKKQDEAMRSWSEGFQDQYKEFLSSKQEDGTYNLDTFQQRLDTLRDTNKPLYDKMIARMPQLEKVGTEITNTSAFTVADLMGYWNDMQAEWIKEYEKEIGRRSEQNKQLAEDAKNAENELDPYLELMAKTAEDGNADAIFDLISGFEENIRKQIIEYLAEQEFIPDSDKFAETVWDEEFMSKVTNSVEGWSVALKAAFSDATGETTKSAEETMYFLETLQGKLDGVNVDNFSEAFHKLYDEAKSTDKKKMLEYLGITSEEANNITDDVVAKIKYNLDKKLLKLYEDTDDRTKKVLPGTSTLLDPKKAGTSEFHAQAETMRKGINDLHKALGQYSAIQDNVLEKGTDKWNEAVENLATYAQVNQDLLKAGVGWDSVWTKLNEDVLLYKNTIEAINAEIESSKGQKVAKGQEEAWNKVAKAAGMTRNQLEQYGQSLIDERSGITFDRKKVSWQAMNAKGWDVEKGSYSTFDSYSTGVQLADGKVVTLTVTPILPNGKVLSEDEVKQYIDDNLQGLDSIDDIFKADNGENGKTIVMNAYEGGTEEIVKQAEAAEMAIHSLSDAYETMAADATFDPQSAFGEYGEGWWEGLERIAGDAQDANQALAQQLITMAQIGQVDTSNINSVDDLMKALGIYKEYGFGEEYKADGMFGSLSVLDSESPDIDKYEKKIVELSKSEKGLQQLGESWNRLSDTQQKSVKKMLGFSDEYYDALKKGTKDAKKWGQETEKAYQMKNLKNLEKSGKVLDGMSKIYDVLNGNTREATDATKKNITTLEKLNKGMTAYKTLSNGAKKGTTEYTDAMKDLTTATGMTEEQLSTASGMAQALSELTSQCDTAQFSLESLVNAMYAIAGSSFDPSTWNNGLITLGSSASAAEKDLANMINTMLSAAGATISATLNADKTVASLHVNGIGSTGSKTTSNKKGGGGGGGGGGGDKNKKTNTPSKDKKAFEQTNWLETIKFQEDQLQDLIDRLGILRERYDMQGYLTGEINTIKQQNEKIREQTELFKKNKDAVAKRIESTKKELATQQKGTEEYDKVLARLKELQDAYAEYDTAILENQNTVLENAEAVKQLRRQILEQEIELRNVLKSAIEDRKQREEDSANAYIDMQDRIIDAIKARYEKERDEVERTTQLKIDALQKETEALSEALEERKALSEEQDKAVELAKLQAQYARIIADPTRAKEALEIQKKITDLQKEMAWDAAEKSVEDQQKSIEKQVEDLEDYQERMNEYYDKLLEDNHNFADEANKVLGGSQEEIIAWLKANDEEYKNSTAEQQAQMVEEWKDSLNTMSGITETVWAEVEQIIAGGDQAIIAFLEANSQEYMEASSYDRQRMLEDWRDQLMYLHRAYENITPNLALHNFTNTAQTWDGESSSGSSSSGGGGGSGGNNNKNPGVKKRTGANDPNNGSNTGVIDGWGLEKDHTVIEKTTGRTLADAAKVVDLIKKKRIAEFDTGGSTGDQEGLAYIHKKERVLTPEQNETFDKVLKTMEALNRIYVSMPSLNPQYSGASTSNITFEGGIHIEVDQLSSDSDYEEVAERVMDYINERIGRGMSVGGVRIN